MRTEVYSYPHSSFLSVEKDMSIIVNMMLKNDRLKKMLHYNSKDCLNRAPLTEDESLNLFGKNIKIVPKLTVDGTVESYIIISFDNFSPNSSNTEFRDNVIEFDIICNYDQWHLKDFELRPYKIAAEIDSMFNGKHLTGIGKLEFIGANQMILTEDYAGVCLMYSAIHGGEDKKGMPNPIDEKNFVDNYNKMFNEE